jgi:molybdopterin converting factor small subunit
MRIQVEFLGLSRIVTGSIEIELDLDQGTTFRDLVSRLAELYPALVGNVIRPDLQTLQAPNIFNLNARKMVQTGQMDSGPGEGDRVILMSMSAGG